ncbi:MAG TPA: VWA domain-containing protein [Candidatus Binatia bacterium]|nr:VWA domain-containing protein [Candidatus Binatia bacterium]
MEFLNPTALYGLLAVPLLLIPYLIRRKPRRLIFSSLLLFAGMTSRSGARPWGRLRLPPIFFLQLLLLILLILALGEPVFSVRPSRIAIVLDNSASMQTLEQGQTRFTLARERARDLLADLGATGRVDLYVTLPRLQKTHADPLNPAEAGALLGRLAPLDLGDTGVDYNSLFARLAADNDYDWIYFITDHPARGDAAKLRVVSVGRPAANWAITSFQISRSSLLTPRLQATVEVTNFSPKDARIKVLLKSGGAVVASRELMVGGGRTSSASFEGFPAKSYYEAEIEPRDSLVLDNRRFAAPPRSQNLRILGVSPRPQELASLRTIPGVSVDLIAPADYEKTDRSGYGLEVFHFSTLAVLPRNPALFVLPPDNNALVDLQKPVARPVVSSWREPHELTRYVNFALFRPNYARPLKANSAGESIIESPDGALAFAVERQGSRYLVLGFDPFPYLGRDNLPVSIFTLNFLDWFVESSRAKAIATGEPLGAGNAQRGDLLITPKGDKIALKPGGGDFAATFYQGIYELPRGGQREWVPVNFDDINESDLREPATIELRGQAPGTSSPSILFAFWPYLLLASLLLLFLEWFINPRVASSRLPKQSKQSVKGL